MKQTTVQQPWVGNGCATYMNATVPWQQEDTTIIGSGVFCMVFDEML
jgi:hypothetical protein